MASASQLLIEGLSDAAGFVVGGVAGFGLGQWVGADIFAEGYGSASLIGIALVGLGAGLGLQGVRRWRQRRTATSQP